ncbi:MAG TPA: hypothetical protein VFB80_14255 [Pirellulaceae bacterium]|nr:hypothetical protein [Pirellulaceae bacterium]
MPLALGPQTIIVPIEAYLGMGFVALAIIVVPTLLIWYTIREQRRIAARGRE